MVKVAVVLGSACALWTALVASTASAAPVNGPIAGLDRPGLQHPQQHAHAGLDASQNLIDHGGPVVHSSTVRLIFWNPSNYGLSWDAGYRELMTQFMQDVGADAGKQTNAYSLTPQYGNASGPAPYNTAFGGRFDDTDSAPASDCTPPSGWSTCLKAGDLSSELRSFISANSLPTGMNQIYVLVTPRGLGSCNSSGTTCLFSGYCAFHSASWSSGDTAGGPSTMLWANIPYTAGVCRSTWPRPNNSTADTEISSISHEDIEILTDPLENAWYTGSSPAAGEIGDVCAVFQGHYLDGSSGSTAYDTVLNRHRYNIQGEWSNADASCQMSEAPVASLAVATPASGRETRTPISFSGTGSSDPDGSIVSYSWDFGDGSTATGRAPSHTYANEGIYAVRLTVTDSEGNTDSIVSPVAVGADEAPSVTLSVRTAHPAVYRSMAFRAAGTDPDGSISSYSWRFGDGSTGTGATPSHLYRKPGSYRVTVTASDSSGQTVTATRSLRVALVASITRARVAKSRGRRVLIVNLSGPGVVVVNGHRFRAGRRGPMTIQLTPLRGRRLTVRFVPRKGPAQTLVVKLR